MYGTIFRINVKSGKEQELIGIFKKWERELKPKFTNALASFVLKSDKVPDEYLVVAVFRDKQSYVANTEDPEQDKWYKQLRQLLQSEPEWNDGEYIISIPK